MPFLRDHAGAAGIHELQYNFSLRSKMVHVDLDAPMAFAAP